MKKVIIIAIILMVSWGEVRAEETKSQPKMIITFEMPDIAREVVIKRMYQSFGHGPAWGATMYAELKSYKFSFSGSYEKTPALAIEAMMEDYRKFMEKLLNAAKKKGGRQ